MEWWNVKSRARHSHYSWVSCDVTMTMTSSLWRTSHRMKLPVKYAERSKTLLHMMLTSADHLCQTATARPRRASFSRQSYSEQTATSETCLTAWQFLPHWQLQTCELLRLMQVLFNNIQNIVHWLYTSSTSLQPQSQSGANVSAAAARCYCKK